MLQRTVTALLPGCGGGAQADALAGRRRASMNTQGCKPRHNYRYVCAE